jgi:hypothetical protein
VTVAPATAVAELGEPVTVKSGGGVTTRDTGTVCVTSPLLAVTVSPYVPGASDAAVAIVKRDVPFAPATVEGENAQLPWAAESPDSDRATSELKPATEPTVIVYEAVPPAIVVAGLGCALSVKSGVFATQ